VDVPDILDLGTSARPGLFPKRTVELGDHLRIRHQGRLAAMGGERLRPGWTEISTLCTDPAYRSRRLATRLVRVVAAGIRERGDSPLPHASATNTQATRLYGSSGSTPRSRTRILQVRMPGTHHGAGAL
jgi:predicted GNAT family acetyltransferase